MPMTVLILLLIMSKKNKILFSIFTFLKVFSDAEVILRNKS